MPVSFTLSEALLVVIGFALGGLIAGAVVFSLMKISRQRKLEACHTDLVVAQERLQAQRQTSERLQQQQQLQSAEQRGLNELVAELRADNAALETLLGEERRQSAEKIATLNHAGERMKAEFENLAQTILEEKSRVFADQNRSAIDGLIAPLREQMGDFKKRIEDVYDKESRDRTVLQTEIRQLRELNQRIGQEALNLTRALKGDSKKRGTWGELILERVLEASGLVKGREFEVQVSLRDSAGRRYQPDALIHLPQGRQVIVDSKVSLKDYEAYFNTDTPAEREHHLAAHVEALRRHIRELSAKSYETLEGVRSLDFTMMFVPIEAALFAALEKESDLWREACEKNIMLVTPATLLVTLRTVQNIWRGENQNRNAVLIAQKAGALYEKFVAFVQALEEVGRHLENAATAYRSAHDRLVDGRGNLVRRALELKSLGVKSTRQLPRELEERAGEE